MNQMEQKRVDHREKLVKLYGEIEAITTNPDANGEDITHGIRLNEEATTLEAELRDVETLLRAAERKSEYTHSNGQRLDALASAAQPDVAPPRDRRPLSQRFADFARQDAFRAYAKDPRGQSPTFELEGEPLLDQRTLIYGGALAADLPPSQFLAGIQVPNEPVGVDAIRRVLLAGTVSSNAITYYQRATFTNNAATVAEASDLTTTGLKPSSALTITQTTDPVEIIAHAIEVTRNALDDVPQLQSLIEATLIAGLVREENDQLLNGNGTAPNISGILDRSGIQNLDQTYFTGAAVQNPGAGGPENYNRILRSKTLIMTTGDSSASFIVANPTDWETLLTLADTTDQYFGFGPFGAATAPRVWNLEVVLSEDKAAGSVLVGDGSAAQVFDRMSSRIFIFDQHSDYALRNILVILAEERLGLAVYRPAAFALVDLV